MQRENQLGQQILLVLALPLLSLDAVWLMWRVKRWGRVPIWGIAFDAMLITGIGFKLMPPVGFLLLLSSFALGMLALARASEDQLEAGYMLGYSWAVTWRLAAGGVLTWIGMIVFVPWDLAASAWSLVWEGHSFTRDEVEHNGVLSGTFINLLDAKLDLARTAYYAAGKLHATPPGSNASETSADLLADWSGRLGWQVRVRTGAPLTIEERSDVRYRKAPSRDQPKAVADGTTRLWSMVSKNDRMGRDVHLWVASAPLRSPDDPEREAFMHRNVHEGMLVQHYLETLSGSPEQIAVLGGTKGKSRPPPADTRVIPWVAVKETQGFWVAFPGGVPAKVDGPIFGLCRRFSDTEERAVMSYAISRGKEAPRDYELWHLEVIDRSVQFEREIGDWRLRGLMGLVGLLPLLPGLFLLGQLVLRAGNE